MAAAGYNPREQIPPENPFLGPLYQLPASIVERASTEPPRSVCSHLPPRQNLTTRSALKPGMARFKCDRCGFDSNRPWTGERKCRSCAETFELRVAIRTEEMTEAEVAPFEEALASYG